MKNFLKKNLWCFILVLLGLICVLLTAISIIFLIVACVIFSIVSIYLAVLLRNKYKQIEDKPEEQVYFDATKLDYDEDVYYIGGDKKPKQIGKTFLAKVSINAPSIALFLLGFGFISIVIVALIQSFF